MKVTKTKDVSLEFTTDQYQRIKAMANLKTSRGETVSSNNIRQRLGLE